MHGNTILCVTYSLLPAVVEGLLPVGQKVGVPAIPKLFGERPLLSCETCCFTLITYLKLFDLLIIERQFSHFSNYPNQTNPRRSKPPEKSLATETWWNMIPTKKDRLQHGLLKRTFFDRLWQRKLRMHPDRHHGSEIESPEMSEMMGVAAGKLTCECFLKCRIIFADYIYIYICYVICIFLHMLNVNKGSVVPKMSEQMRWCAGPKPNSHPLIGMVYQFFSLSKPPKRSVVVGGSALFKVVGPWGKVQPMRLSIFRKPTVCCAQCCIRGTNRSRNLIFTEMAWKIIIGNQNQETHGDLKMKAFGKIIAI